MTINKVALFLLISSIIALTGALVSQYIFNMQPCILCIYQRIPYVFVVFFSILILYFNDKINIIKILLLLCFVALITDAAIAFFHVGVEYKWWEGTDKCASAGTQGASIEALRASLYAAPTVRCDEPQFTFILTMAGWNFLYALCLAVVTLLSGIKFKLFFKTKDNNI